MATLDYYIAFSFPAPDGEVISGGSRTAPESITVDGNHKNISRSLANNTTIDVWITGADESVTDFDFAYFVSDQNVYLELTVDKGNDVGREEIAIELQAGIPFALTSDDAYALYTTDFAAGTADVIDQIRIRNVSGSTANVRAMIVT